MIESPAALPNLAAIASLKPLVGLALGTEHSALELGGSPTLASLDLATRQIPSPAAARRLMAFAAPISIAAYREAPAYRDAVLESRGWRGSYGLPHHAA